MFHGHTSQLVHKLEMRVAANESLVDSLANHSMVKNDDKEDLKEDVAAFLEKRKPEFKHR
jgi:hypothetical protein